MAGGSRHHALYAYGRHCNLTRIVLRHQLLALRLDSCRLLRNRCGVCISAIKRAARIGPM
jgi:hypothetical protein